MNELRGQLHKLVDELPDHTLDHARTALDYCVNPEQHRMTIENAKQRATENAKRNLREHAERTGHGFISGIGSGGGHTFADGTHHSTMTAFEDGREATYHLYMFRGTIFEIIETIEISQDGQRLIRRERIKGIDGIEQILTAELPVSAPFQAS
ncbi:MAG: hypothetical protein JWO20_999 [Candidatus Angelobacter sp.]|jgi:hypothetical protein|nr:hypothetical protein [Candidatus Angelobacter sp.]